MSSYLFFSDLQKMISLNKTVAFVGNPLSFWKLEKFLMFASIPDILMNNPLKAFIKNMTTVPSQKQVKTIVEDLGLQLVSIDIGEIEVGQVLSDQQYDKLRETLRRNDFELISGKENILTEKIKNVIIEMIHYSDELPVIKYSSYISTRLKTNYTYLSKIFSKVKKVTIEHFIILHKIERVKQLLLFTELTLSEIAWKLHYSSTAHLSAQFKKITGITPSLFKKSEYKELTPLESL